MGRRFAQVECPGAATAVTPRHPLRSGAVDSSTTPLLRLATQPARGREVVLPGRGARRPPAGGGPPPKTHPPNKTKRRAEKKRQLQRGHLGLRDDLRKLCQHTLAQVTFAHYIPGPANCELR